MKSRRTSKGFSLVEVLLTVTIIGIIIYLAMPNIIQVRSDAEDSLAIARTGALNLAVAAYFQARGETAAQSEWTNSGNSSTAARYNLVRGYLAFAPSNYADYMPAGYTATFSNIAPHRQPAALINTNTGAVVPY